MERKRGGGGTINTEVETASHTWVWFDLVVVSLINYTRIWNKMESRNSQRDCSGSVLQHQRLKAVRKLPNNTRKRSGVCGEARVFSTVRTTTSFTNTDTPSPAPSVSITYYCTNGCGGPRWWWKGRKGQEQWMWERAATTCSLPRPPPWDGPRTMTRAFFHEPLRELLHNVAQEPRWQDLTRS